MGPGTPRGWAGRGAGCGSAPRELPHPWGAAAGPESSGNIRPGTAAGRWVTAGGAGKDPANFSGAGKGIGSGRGRDRPCVPGPQSAGLATLGSGSCTTAPCLWGRSPRLTRTVQPGPAPRGETLARSRLSRAARAALSLSLSRRVPGHLGWCQPSYQWLKVHRVPQRRGPVQPRRCPCHRGLALRGAGSSSSGAASSPAVLLVPAGTVQDQLWGSRHRARAAAGLSSSGRGPGCRWCRIPGCRAARCARSRG